jgi:hypothetical protein
VLFGIEDLVHGLSPSTEVSWMQQTPELALRDEGPSWEENGNIFGMWK